MSLLFSAFSKLGEVGWLVAKVVQDLLLSTLPSYISQSKQSVVSEHLPASPSIFSLMLTLLEKGTMKADCYTQEQEH